MDTSTESTEEPPSRTARTSKCTQWWKAARTYLASNSVRSWSKRQAHHSLWQIMAFLQTRDFHLALTLAILYFVGVQILAKLCDRAALEVALEPPDNSETATRIELRSKSEVEER